MREPTHVTLPYKKPFPGSPESIPHPGHRLLSVCHLWMLSQISFSVLLSCLEAAPPDVCSPSALSQACPSDVICGQQEHHCLHEAFHFPRPLGGIYLLFLSSLLHLFSLLPCTSQQLPVSVTSGRLDPAFILTQGWSSAREGVEVQAGPLQRAEAVWGAPCPGETEVPQSMS